MEESAPAADAVIETGYRIRWRYSQLIINISELADAGYSGSDDSALNLLHPPSKASIVVCVLNEPTFALLYTYTVSHTRSKCPQYTTDVGT